MPSVFFKYIFLLHWTHLSFYSCAPINSGSDDDPHEIQHAVCKVFTKEIEASAKATITRQLKGVCSTRDLNRKLQHIEDKILDQLQQIQQALGSKVQKRPLAPSTEPPIDYHEYEEDLPNNTEYGYFKQLNGEKPAISEEIAVYNDTIINAREGDVYFYYWRIEEISNTMAKKNLYISSPQFSVLGHTLHLHFYPNYSGGQIGIVCKPDSNSFMKKYKIWFLGHNQVDSEISSKILYTYGKRDNIFLIDPQILDENFIVKNNVLIKLTIYLNS
ncbi:uncharacterized protein LOC132702278 isoform X2 [Cylas formicarius]|uniref:uncharacterized protein LOC132702278 isoform X2 n=1 Tax=Cylas formicarius TaxID=197179 RepID=UPI002958C0F1|nr:uncharacterized protein LOC132702278 isoform X2 [Cylas formicarius]